MPHIDLPPVTDAHRRAAFDLFAWPGLTFEAAMAIDLRCRLINARAAAVRTAEFKQHAAPQRAYLRRINPATGAWCTQAVLGPWIDSPQKTLA